MPYTASFLDRLHGALLAAFSRDDLRQLVALCLDADFDHIAAEKGFSDQVFEFVQWAVRRDRIEDLVVCAQEARPSDTELAALRRELQGPQMACGADSVITDGGIDVRRLVDRLAGRLNDEGAAQRLTDDELKLLRDHTDAHAHARHELDVQSADQGVFQQYVDLFTAEGEDNEDAAPMRSDSQADA